MIVSCLVIAHYTFLNTLGRYVKCNMNLSVRTSLCRENPEFNSIQCISRISSCNVCKELQCFLVNFRMIASHTFFLIIDCPLQKCFDIFFFKRMKFKDTGTGN